MNPDTVDFTDVLETEGLYHLATVQEWAAYRSVAGVIEPASLTTEGFVHCSWGTQVSGTVARHFADVPELLALRLDSGALGSAALVEEDSYASGQTFPHVYGPIPLAAVLEITVISGMS